MESLKKENAKFLLGQIEQIKQAMSNNILKMFVFEANEHCGLGRARICRILDALSKDLADMRHDNETFFLKLEEECKRILTKEVYDKYFIDIPFNLMPEETLPEIE